MTRFERSVQTLVDVGFDMKGFERSVYTLLDIGFNVREFGRSVHRLADMQPTIAQNLPRWTEPGGPAEVSDFRIVAELNQCQAAASSHAGGATRVVAVTIPASGRRTRSRVVWVVGRVPIRGASGSEDHGLVAEAIGAGGGRGEMRGLFKQLWDRVDNNAHRAVDVYISEIPDFRSVAKDARARASMLDLAVLLRRREVELAADGAPFTGKDLAMLTAFGAQRGAQGVSLSSRRRVLDLHDVLTLREIHEAAGLNEIDHVTEMIGWLPANALAGQNAYTQGFLNGHKRSLPFVKRVQDLAETLLADMSVVPDFAESLKMGLADLYVITVVRISGGPSPTDQRREEIVGALLKSHQVPMTWRDPDELVALLPCGDAAAAEERALCLVHDFAQTVGRPCATGAATGRIRALRDTVALARRISQVAPVDTVPRRLHVMADVFVELGVAQLPQVDEWLRGLARQLASGPDLVATLDAYYQHDMNRLHTAGALRIHPRTLDYRFRRVRELVGMDPGSVQGVRVLSAVVTRVLAGRWS